VGETTLSLPRVGASTVSGIPSFVTVRVDPRMGSGDLVAPLRQLGIPCQLAEPVLPYGDLEIVGRGPDDRSVLLGVEIKSVSEILEAVTDTRFVGHQLVGLLESYEISYLLTEGVMAAAPNRELVFLRQREGKLKYEKASRGERAWTYEAVQSFLRSVERSGIREAFTPDRRSTAAWIASLYHSWAKPWDSHKSLARIHHTISDNPNPLELFSATTKMKVADDLIKGIGWERARAAAKHFPSVRAMVNADEKEWQQVDGIGRKLAAAIVASVSVETKE
jgi:ERCC4-type nuclease